MSARVQGDTSGDYRNLLMRLLDFSRRICKTNALRRKHAEEEERKHSGKGQRMHITVNVTHPTQPADSSGNRGWRHERAIDSHAGFPRRDSDKAFELAHPPVDSTRAENVAQMFSSVDESDGRRGSSGTTVTITTNSLPHQSSGAVEPAETRGVMGSRWGRDETPSDSARDSSGGNAVVTLNLNVNGADAGGDDDDDDEDGDTMF